MADKVVPNYDQIQYDQQLNQDGLYDETIDAFKETWWVREVSGVFEPNKPPRIDLSENVRNVLACWWAPFPLEIVNRSNAFSTDLATFADRPDIDFLPSLTIGVSFELGFKMLTMNDIRIGNKVGDRKLYLFSRTKELPDNLDEIFVLKLTQSVTGKNPPYAIVGILEPLSKTTTGLNSRFVVFDMNARGYKPTEFDYISSVKLITGADNYWPNDLEIKGEYSINGNMVERQVPFKVANTFPLNYDILQMRNEQAEISLLASRDNFMLKTNRIRSLFGNVGGSIPLPNGFSMVEPLNNLLFTTIMISEMVKKGFKNVKEFATQSDKDNNIQTWAYFLRSQLEGKSAADVGLFIGNIISEARYYIENTPNGTYKAVFNTDNPRGTFTENATITPTITDSQWNELYAILAMASENVFSKYSFAYGNNASARVLLPFYIDFDLSAFDVFVPIYASNAGTEYSNQNLNLSNNNSKAFKAILKSSFMESTATITDYSISSSQSPRDRLTSQYGWSVPATSDWKNIVYNQVIKFGTRSERTIFPGSGSVIVGVQSYKWITNDYDYPDTTIINSLMSIPADSTIYDGLKNGVLTITHEYGMSSDGNGYISRYSMDSNTQPTLKRLAFALNNPTEYQLVGGVMTPETTARILSMKRRPVGSAQGNTNVIDITLEFTMSLYIDIDFKRVGTNGNTFFKIKDNIALKSEANVITLGDQSVILSDLPETLGESTIYSLASLYPDASVSGNWVWIKTEPGQNAINVIAPFTDTNFQSANYSFRINNATTFDFDVAGQDPSNITNLKNIRNITSNNLYSTNIELEFVLKKNGEKDQVIRIGKLSGSLRNIEKIVLGDPADHTIGLTEISL